jgi:hypothetical protein
MSHSHIRELFLPPTAAPPGPPVPVNPRQMAAFAGRAVAGTLLGGFGVLVTLGGHLLTRGGCQFVLWGGQVVGYPENELTTYLRRYVRGKTDDHARP